MIIRVWNDLCLSGFGLVIWILKLFYWVRKNFYGLVKKRLFLI